MNKALLYKKKLQQRFRKAMKEEAGCLLSAAEVRMLAPLIGADKLPNIGTKKFKKSANKSSGTKTKADVHIRWMINRDMPEVMEIESQLPGSLSIDHYDITKNLRQRNVIGMVAEICGSADMKKDVVGGYMIYELNRSYIRLQRILVNKDHRRQGLATALVAKLKSKITTIRRNRIIIDVLEEDLDTQVFCRDQGFIAVSNNESGYIEFVYEHE